MVSPYNYYFNPTGNNLENMTNSRFWFCFSKNSADLGKSIVLRWLNWISQVRFEEIFCAINHSFLWNADWNYSVSRHSCLITYTRVSKFIYRCINSNQIVKGIILMKPFDIIWNSNILLGSYGNSFKNFVVQI